MKYIEFNCIGDYVAVLGFIVGMMGLCFYVVPNLMK